MRSLLIVTAIIEITTGIALLALPAQLASILLGAPLDTSAGQVVGRLAGSALISLGVACCMGSRDPQSRAASGVVVAMLVYNIAAVVLLISSRFCVGMTGAGLLPASVLHTALAIWCIACLRTPWSQGNA